MAHHQGMSLVSLSNVIEEDRMEKRFHADPTVQATELLLQERIPVGVRAAHPRAEEVLSGRVAQTLTGMITRVYHRVDTDTPRTQLLSNGTYNVMVTAAGAGYSNCGVNAVTAGAKTSLETTGEHLFTCATCAAAPYGRRVINRSSSPHHRMRLPSRKTKQTSGAWTPASQLTWKSSFRLRITRRCGGFH